MSDLRVVGGVAATPPRPALPRFPPALAPVRSRQTLDAFEPARARAAVALEDPAPPAPVDGRAWMAARLEELKAKVAAGEPARVVFDIDDTLSDSRGRTLALAKRWDAEQGTAHFADLTLDGVKKDGYLTAREAGLSKDVAKQFMAYWRKAFFEPQNSVHDLPIQELIDWAKAASDAGIEVRYLTGRPEEIRASTRAELLRLGLPQVDDAHLFMKPSLNDKTAEYKVGVLQEWVKDGTHHGWYITESRRDVNAIHAGVPQIPTVLLDSERERDGAPVDPSTPIYPDQTAPKPAPADPWEPEPWVSWHEVGCD